MSTYGDLIDASLTEIGVLASGETAESGDATFALNTLNRLLSTWAGQRLIIPSLTRNTFAITANVATHTIGPTGNIVMTMRPAKLLDVRLIDTAPAPDLETPLGELTDDEYQALPQKALTSTLPINWWYNATVPNGVITLWPVPTGTGLQLAVYVAEPLSQVAAITTTVSLAPGYEELIVTNLAIRLAPSFDRQPSPDLKQAAQESMATVKRGNKRPAVMTFEAAVLGNGGGRYDINSDEFIR
jgi:hypothetical protein